MLCEWKTKKRSEFSLDIPPQVQNKFEYEDWIPISLIASFTRTTGYTDVSTQFLTSLIYDFTEHNLNDLLHDLKDRGYIQTSIRKEGNKSHRIIVLTPPLYKMFKSIDNSMHEPTQPE